MYDTIERSAGESPARVGHPGKKAHISDQPSSARTTSTSGGQNTLAIIAFLLALVAPILFLMACLASLIHITSVANSLFGVLGTVTVPFAIAAIILGHIAMAHIKQAQNQPRRGFALASLILGYGALATFVGFLVFILATLH